MILLKNGTYINWQTLEFLKTDILVEEGNAGKLKFPGEFPAEKNVKTIDCTGKLITKSFANGHHHAYSALAAGMPAPKKIPVNFPEILQYIWWTLDKALDPAMIRASALVTAMAAPTEPLSDFQTAGIKRLLKELWDSVGHDMTIDAIALALENNRDLRVAILNIEQSRAQYQIQRAVLFPRVDATAGANFQRSE